MSLSEKPVRLGQRVEISSKDTVGVVAYIGNTDFSQGKWIGVVLDEPKGRNNGTVQGKTYFTCNENYGVFVRQTQLTVIDGASDDENFSTPTATPGKPKSKLPRGSLGRSMSSLQPKISPPRESRTSKEIHKKDLVPAKTEVKKQKFTETGFVKTLTFTPLPSHFTPGPPSPAMQTLEDRANAVQTQQEIENLKAEIQDLNEKLETIRVKRTEDKEKLKDAEKLKIQVEQLLEFKSRIMESQTVLQKDLAKARQEAKEAVDSREALVQESEELQESTEMLTLDKEMAEEKAETLQMEYDQAKERIEELMLDLEILKAEESEVPDSNNKNGPATNVQVKQLEQQNQRLHETLVRMRDIAAHDKHELQKLQKEMESYKSESQELSKIKEKLTNQINDLEETVADLQEQVDAALGAEEMVETLTDRNLDLEDRVKELRETVADLESLNDMNDQLQENARDTELELREELDLANAKVRDAGRECDALNEVIVDRGNTIKKFRDLVQKLQDDNIELRSSLQKESSKPLGTPSEIIDFKKMFSETKAHGKAIELELRVLEVQQAKDHVTYLMQYLPENFMVRGGDHDAILMLLLLPRLKSKCDILINGLRDRYSNNHLILSDIDRNAVLKGHAVDQYLFAARISHMLSMIQTYVNQFYYISRTCKVDVFLHMGTFYSDMLTQERNVDFYVDLLRKDQLDETISLEHLEKSVSFMVSLHSNHLMEQKIDQSLLLSDVAKALMSATDSIGTEVASVRTLLAPTETPGEMSDLCLTLGKLSSEVNGCVKRIKRRLPSDGSSGPINYPTDVQNSIKDILSDMFSVLKTLRHISKSAMMQTSLLGDSESGIPNAKLLEFLHQATDLEYGSEDQGPKSLIHAMENAQTYITNVTDNMDKGEYDFDGTVEKKAIPPVSLRAEIRKTELKETEHLKYKLEARDLDVNELKILAKQKNEELSQMAIRRDMAEKKLTTANRDADITIEKLQRKLDDTSLKLVKKEKEFNDTMDHLQNDIESLEVEKGELKEKLKNVNRRSIYEAVAKTSSVAPGSLTSPSTPSGGIGMSLSATGAPTVVTDSPLLLQHISNLKDALKHAKSENHYNTLTDMQKKLALLKPLKIFHMSSKPKSIDNDKGDLSKDERKHKEHSNKIQSLIQRVNRLKSELLVLMAGTSIIDLRKKKNRDHCLESITSISSPFEEVIQHQEKVNNVQKEIKQLQSEITCLVASCQPGGSIITSFATFTTPQFTKALDEKELLKIGKVTVGQDKGTEPVKLVMRRSEDLKLLINYFA